MVFREFIEYMFYFLVEPVLHIVNFILFCVMNVQKNEITSATSSYYVYVRHPITNSL
jgi:hypothetical protein